VKWSGFLGGNMGEFFSYDGPFFKYGNLLADMVILSFLWIILSLPIITIGATTTAGYYVTTRRLAEKDSYFIREFFKAFKREFIKSTVIWLPLLIAGVLVVANIFFLNNDGEETQIFSSTVTNIMVPLQFFILFEVIMISLYVFPIGSRFDMKGFTLLKTAFFMAHRHILITLVLLVLLVGGFFLILWLYNFLFALLFPGVFFMVSSMLHIRIFKKYRPEMDKTDAGE